MNSIPEIRLMERNAIGKKNLSIFSHENGARPQAADGGVNAMCGIDAYRAPLGRTNFFAGRLPSPLGWAEDRGRDGALVCAAPPSEPCVRISRTRLSSRGFPARPLQGFHRVPETKGLRAAQGSYPALVVFRAHQRRGFSFPKALMAAPF